MSKNKNNVNNVPNNEAAVQEGANAGGEVTPAVDQSNDGVQNPPATTGESEKKGLKEKWNEAFDPEKHPKRYKVKEGAKTVGKVVGWMGLGAGLMLGGLAIAASNKQSEDDNQDYDDDIDELEDLEDDDNIIDSTAEEVEAE
jgi:hypothetical protein